MEAVSPESELMLIRLVTAAMGRLSLSLAKMVKKGQTMVVPVVEMTSPSSINQNWVGYFLNMGGFSFTGLRWGRLPHR